MSGKIKYGVVILSLLVVALSVVSANMRQNSSEPRGVVPDYARPSFDYLTARGHRLEMTADYMGSCVGYFAGVGRLEVGAPGVYGVILDFRSETTSHQDPAFRWAGDSWHNAILSTAQRIDAGEREAFITWAEDFRQADMLGRINGELVAPKTENRQFGRWRAEIRGGSMTEREIYSAKLKIYIP